MAKCKSGCGCRPRIVSTAVQNLATNGWGCSEMECGKCYDVCVNPIFGTPNTLSLLAPLIYDEIGINLCTTITVADLATTYPTATSAKANVIDVTFTAGAGGVTLEQISNRPNCWLINLTNLSVTLAVSLYDNNCRLLGTIYPTVVYLPSDETAPTYDEDTNPSSVELEIYAPYGPSYDTTGTTPAAVLNVISQSSTNNIITQGINLYALAKALNLDVVDNEVTIGLTVIVQSLYFAGYRVASQGRINTPKGSIILPDNSSCMKFVAGDLLDLAIKPLELGPPKCQETLKDTCDKCENNCANECEGIS